MTKLLVLILMGFNAHAFEASKVLGSCDYYPALSAELKCDDSGYLVQFGQYYCERFNAERERFSDAGKGALDVIRVCLQEQIDIHADLTCDTVKDLAAASHVPCYRTAKYCEMSVWDKLTLADIVAPALLDPTLRQAVERIEGDCLWRPF